MCELKHEVMLDKELSLIAFLNISFGRGLHLCQLGLVPGRDKWRRIMNRLKENSANFAWKVYCKTLIHVRVVCAKWRGHEMLPRYTFRCKRGSGMKTRREREWTNTDNTCAANNNSNLFPFSIRAWLFQDENPRPSRNTLVSRNPNPKP